MKNHRPRGPQLLVGGTAAALLTLALLSASLGPYLNDRITSRPAVFGVYLLWMSAILVAAALAAVLSLRIMFPKKVQEAAAQPHRLPRKVVTPGDEEFLDDGAAAPSLFQPLNLYFAIFLIAFLMGFVFLANVLSSGTLSNIKRVGFDAMSRSQDPQQVLALFEEMSDMQQASDVVHFTRLLPRFYDDPRPGIREAAFHTTAVMARRITISIAVMNQGGEIVRDRGERELLTWLKDDVAPYLRKAARQPDAPAQEILLALAWIIDERNVPLFRELLKSPRTPQEQAVSAAVGLCNIGTVESAEILVDAVPWQTDGQVRSEIFWGIRHSGENLEPVRVTEGEEARILAIVQRLLATLPPMDPRDKCQAIAALAPFEHSGATGDFIRLFQDPASAVDCPRIEIEPLESSPILFVAQQPLRMVILDNLRRMGAGNEEFLSWLGSLELTTLDPQTAEQVTKLRGTLKAR